MNIETLLKLKQFLADMLEAKLTDYMRVAESESSSDQVLASIELGLLKIFQEGEVMRELAFTVFLDGKPYPHLENILRISRERKLPITEALQGFFRGIKS